jgi:hypothetical protein
MSKRQVEKEKEQKAKKKSNVDKTDLNGTF